MSTANVTIKYPDGEDLVVMAAVYTAGDRFVLQVTSIDSRFTHLQALAMVRNLAGTLKLDDVPQPPGRTH